MAKAHYAQLPLFEPESTWVAPSMSDLPTSWGDGRVAIDIEGRDDTLTTLGPGVRRGGYICGVSIAFEDGPAFYLPIRHAGGGNMDSKAVIAYLKGCGRSFTGILVGANLGFDLDYLEEVGITFPLVKWFRDIQVADPLINELHNNYSMEHIAERWNMPGKDERLLKEALAAYGYKGNDTKRGIWALPARHVGPYAEEDARLPLKILRRQERVIEDQGLWPIFNLESKVLPVLIKMRRRGVLVSEDRLDQVAEWSRSEQDKAIQEANRSLVHKLHPNDITNTKSLAAVLTELGFTVPKTVKGNDSVTAAVLDKIEHPVADLLRRAKQMSTLRSTFVNGVREHLTNGRAHCTFNQLRRQKDGDSADTEGAAFGRLSSSNFNFQNQPARDPEIGPMWRSIYLPDEGKKWCSLDYSQQEPRQAVHFAVKAGAAAIGMEAWKSAVEAARRYREDPTMDYHDMMTRMINGEDTIERVGPKGFSQLRKYAKQVFLGKCYGMGGAKLCRDLGLPTAWRLSWKEGRRWRNKDYETREDVTRKSDDARRAGYEVRFWECAGAEGSKIIDTFDERVPFVKKMADLMSKQVERTGIVETLLGRHCHFPEKDGGYDWLHKAFNRLIQGSSADQTKQAVVDLDAAGWPLQLQVHDEVDGSVEDEAEARRGADIMENCVPLEVPMKVDIEMGDSWGDSM